MALLEIPYAGDDKGFWPGLEEKPAEGQPARKVQAHVNRAALD